MFEWGGIFDHNDKEYFLKASTFACFVTGGYEPFVRKATTPTVTPGFCPYNERPLLLSSPPKMFFVSDLETLYVYATFLIERARPFWKNQRHPRITADVPNPHHGTYQWSLI